MDAIFASKDLGPLVLRWADVETLLALRLTCRGGKQAADSEFSLVEARRRVWLCRVGPTTRSEEGKDVMTRLAKKGELRFIQWARIGERVEWDEHATAWAAFHGHIDVIQWMCFEANPPMPYATRHMRSGEYPREYAVGIECAYAARAGRLDVLEWLRARDFALSNQSCHEAAREGHLHILKRIAFVCDPYTTWLPFLMGLIIAKRSHVYYSSGNPEPGSERWYALYKEGIQQWLPILEWFAPFSSAHERRQIYREVPWSFFA
jgi:uncharacterized protein (DUF2132 family)